MADITVDNCKFVEFRNIVFQGGPAHSIRLVKNGVSSYTISAPQVGTSIELEYYRDKVNTDTFTIALAGRGFTYLRDSLGNNVGITYFLPDMRTHIAKLNKLKAFTIVANNGDRYVNNIDDPKIFYLHNPNTIRYQDADRYLNTRTVSGQCAAQGINRVGMNINVPFYNQDVLWSIYAVLGSGTNTPSEFPILITGRNMYYEITGSVISTSIVSIRFRKYGATGDDASRDYPLTVVDTDLPTPVPETPPTSERARTTLTGWQKVANENNLTALLNQVPDIPNSDILNIKTISSLNSSLVPSNTRTYNDETSDNRYLFQFPTGTTRYLRIEITKNDNNKVISPTYIVSLNGDKVSASSVSIINSLFRTVPTSIKQVNQTAIDFRIESDLLLDERLTQVRVYISANRTMLKATYVNSAENPWAELALTGLIHGTKYTAYFTYTWQGVEIDAYQIQFRTVERLSSGTVDEQTKEQAVSEVLIENLPNQQYEHYRILDFSQRLEIASEILGNKMQTPGNTGGIDMNANNQNQAQRPNRANSVFSKDTGTTIQDIIAEAVLTVPEPNENTDLYEEPYT